MPVALPGAHQPEVGDDRRLQDVLAAAEVARLLGRRADDDVAVGVVPPRQPALGDLGAAAGRGEERRDPRATGPHPLGERALGASARPPAHRRGTAGRTPCSPRRTTRSSAAAASPSAAGPDPTRRPHSCSTPPRDRPSRPRAPRRSAPTGRRTARTHRPRASHRPGCRPPPPRHSPRPCPSTHLLRAILPRARRRYAGSSAVRSGSVERPDRRARPGRGRRHRTSTRRGAARRARGAPSTRCRRASTAGCPAWRAATKTGWSRSCSSTRTIGRSPTASASSAQLRGVARRRSPTAEQPAEGSGRTC